eukprot:768441-Hanusia_phi.AAC.19
MFLGSSLYLHFAKESELFTSVSARISGTNTLGTRWLSNSSVECKVTFGSSSSTAAQITFSVMVGSLSEIISFNTIALSSTRERNIASTGSNKILLLPGIVPSPSSSIGARLGQTAFERTSWISTTTIGARIACGTFFLNEMNPKVAVSAVNVVGSASNVLSYDSQVISTSRRVNSPPALLNKVTLIGLAFGSSAYTAVFATRNTVADFTLWRSDSAIECKVSGGEARSLATKLTQNNNVETMTSLFSFDKPAFARLAMMNLEMNRAPINSLHVTFRASNIGLNDFSLMARSALTACEQITASIQIGTGSNSASFDIVQLSGIDSYNQQVFLPSKDAIVFGTNYGLSTKSLSARAFTACEQTIWNSFTNLRCIGAGKVQKGHSLMMILTIQQQASAGAACSLQARITLLQTLGSSSEILSYENPLVKKIQSSLCQSLLSNDTVLEHCVAQNISTSLRLQANFQKSYSNAIFIGEDLGNFDLSQRLRTGETHSPRTMWISDTAVLAVAASGTRHSSKVLLTAAVVPGTISELLSFDALKISAIQIRERTILSIVIRSQCFNLSSVVSQPTLPPPLNDTSPQPQLSKYLYGFLNGLPCSSVKLKAANNHTNESKGIIFKKYGSNEPPSHSTLSRSHLVSLVNLATKDFSPRGVLAATSFAKTSWISTTTVSCTLPSGIGRSETVALTVIHIAGSVSEMTSYDTSETLAVFAGKNKPSTGSTVMEISSASLSTSDRSASGRSTESTSSEFSRWLSDTFISIKSSHGIHNLRSVLLTSGCRTPSTLSEAVSFDSPLDMDVIPQSRPATGLSIVTVIGMDFAQYDSTTRARFGGTNCETTMWTSSTSASCLLASGVGTAHSITFTTGIQISPYSYGDPPKVKEFQFSYSKPILLYTKSSTGDSAHGSTRGGWTLTIEGANFGFFADLIRVAVSSNLWSQDSSIGRIECKIPRTSLCVGCGNAHVRDDQALCVVPAGDGNSLAITFADSDQTSYLLNGFSYSRPRIYSVSSNDDCAQENCGNLAVVESLAYTSSPSEGDVTVNRILYIEGDSFGLPTPLQGSTFLSKQSMATVYVGSRLCENTQVRSGGTVITCTWPKLLAGAMGCNVEEVVIEISGQRSSVSSKHSVLSIQPQPIVVPFNPNKKACAWIDGDGAGMTITFGKRDSTTIWSPTRTNQGRPYKARPGSRSDDFQNDCNNRPLPWLSTSCSHYLTSITLVDLQTLLGEGASCRWLNPAILHVAFGFGTTVLPVLNPPATMRIRAGVVFAYGAPSYSSDSDILIEPPTTPRPLYDQTQTTYAYAKSPRVNLHGKTTFGACDPLVLKAEVDYASGSRSNGLVFTWSSNPDIAAVRRASGEGLQYSELQVSPDDPEFDSGQVYVITVTVTNFLGLGATTSKTVQREDIKLPTVEILGDPVRRIRRNSPLVISAHAYLPPCVGTLCSCLDTTNDYGWDGTTSAILDIQWSTIGQPSNTLLSKQVSLVTTSVVIILEETVRQLDIGSNYTIQVEAGVWTGFKEDSVERYASIAQVQILPVKVAPVSRIRGGNRKILQDSRIVLDGTDSWDPDWRPNDPKFKFEWFLDCETMYLEIEQYLKDAYQKNSKDYIAQCTASTLNTLFYNLNQANSGGSSIFDTLNTGYSTISDRKADFERFHPAGANYFFPILIIIGLKVTDVDGASGYATSHIEFVDLIEDGGSFPIGLEPLFLTQPLPNNPIIFRIDSATYVNVLTSDTTVKYTWWCDTGSSRIPMIGSVSSVGVLEVQGQAFQSRTQYKISLSASWPSGKYSTTWLNFTTADSPRGGSLDVSMLNGTAMVDRWSVVCNLWTTTDPDLLPLTYSFAVNIGGRIGEIRIREHQNSAHHDNFVLPSSRVLKQEPGVGVILCRVNCEVKLIAEIKDLLGATSRVNTTVLVTRPGCLNAVDACSTNAMLSIVDAALQSIDVQAADLQPLNYLLLLITIEVSDADLFSYNATVGAQLVASRSRLSENKQLPSTFSQVALTRKNPSNVAIPKKDTETLEYFKDLVESGIYEVTSFTSTGAALAEDIAMALSTERDNIQVEAVDVENT